MIHFEYPRLYTAGDPEGIDAGNHKGITVLVHVTAAKLSQSDGLPLSCSDLTS